MRRTSPAARLLAGLVLCAVLLPAAAHAQFQGWQAYNDSGRSWAESTGLANPEADTESVGLLGRAWGNIKAGIFTTFQWILTVIIMLLAYLLVFLGNVLDIVLLVSRFSTNELVKAGWTFVRDALNFVFILALLAIAFATVAGIEGYGMRALLPRLLIAALLVNFSLAISGAFVDFSRILMHTMTGANALGGGGQGTTLALKLANVSAVSDFYTFRAETKFLPVLPKEYNFADLAEHTKLLDVLAPLLSVMIVALIVIAIGAVTLLLVIRVVALYILLILSPVAYVFTVLPQTAGYARQWWDAFLRYTFVGPIMVFFLILAARIGTRPGQGGQNAKPAFETLRDDLGIEGGGAVVTYFTESPFAGSLFQATFMVLFLFAALAVAVKLGVFGAGAVSAGAQRAAAGVGLAPGRVGLFGAQAAGLGLAKFGEYLAGTELGRRAGLGRRAQRAVAPLRYGRAAIGGAARILRGESLQEQLDRQKKALAGRGETAILAQARLGNMAAQELAIDRDYDLSEQDFRAFTRTAPPGSEFRRKVHRAYRQKFGVSAETGLSVDALKNAVTAGPTRVPAGLTDQMRGKEDQIRKNLRRIKPEDTGKAEEQIYAGLLRATEQAQAGEDMRSHAIDVTPARMRQIAENTSRPVQDALREYLRAVETRVPGGISATLRRAAERYAGYTPAGGGPAAGRPPAGYTMTPGGVITPSP